MKSHQGLAPLALVLLSLSFAQTSSAQAVHLSHTSLSFSGHAVGQPSSPLTVTLVNPDAFTPLSISSITASGDYSETDNCNGSVAPSGSCTLSIVFKPNAVGLLPGVITLNDDANDSPQLIAATGAGLLPVNPSPATVTFGTVAVGSTSSAQTVTITNGLAKSVSIKFSASSDFTAAAGGTTPCGSSLPGKSACTVSVKFAPTVAGTVNGALSIKQSINATPAVVPLSGTGSGGSTPPLSFSPGNVAFGNIAAGTSSQKTVSVTNTSASTVTISALAASGDYTVAGVSPSPCGGALAPNGHCSIAITFQPTATTEVDGAVSITNNSSVRTQILNLSGKGIQAVSLSPNSLTFAAQQQGTSSAPQSVTVTNHLRTPLTLNSTSLTGGYSMTTNCGNTLAASATCTIAVTFTPIAKSGAVNGTLTINSSAPSSPVLLQLHGQSTGSLTRFAYVANRGDNTISMYTVNLHTGQLRSNGYVLAAQQPNTITVAPSNKFAYVVNSQDNTVSVFAIDSATGFLTQNSALTVATGSIPTSLSLTPSGTFAYVSNDDGTVSGYAVDAGTGALTAAPGSPFPAGNNPYSVAVSPSGNFVYVDNLGDATVSAFQIDASTGALTQIVGSPFPAGTLPAGIVVDPSGKFAYVVNFFDNTISAYQINASTGALVQVPGSPYPTGTEPDGVAIDNSGRYVFVANGFGGSVSVYSINLSTGALATVPGSPFATPGNDPFSVTVDATNQFVYVGDPGFDNVSTFALNGATGALALVAIAPTRVSPYAAAVVAGPAPIAYLPKFAYATDTPDQRADAYLVGTVTGELSNISATPTGGYPYSVSADPFGRWAFAVNQGTQTISVYSIDPVTGSLTPVPGSPFPADVGAFIGAVDPSGRFLFVSADPNVSAYTIDQASGALTPVPGSPFPGSGVAPISLAVDPSGRFLYLADTGTSITPSTVSALAINPVTGALTAVPGSPFPAGTEPFSVVVEASGRFVYVANAGDSSICAYSINPASGALTAIGSPLPASGVETLAVHPFGSFLYATLVPQTTNNTIGGYSINPVTGSLTEIPGSPFATGEQPEWVAIDPSGKFLYAPNANDRDFNSIFEYSIDPASGALSQFDVFNPAQYPGVMTVTGVYH